MNKFVRFTLAAVAAVCVIPVMAGCRSDGGEEGVAAETTFAEEQNSSQGETRYNISETATYYEPSAEETGGQQESGVVEDGSYTSMEEVSSYIHEYGHLPDNYITKSEAKKLGWKSSEGNLSVVAPGKSIGGDSFGNREGLLPKESGRKYYECDIDYTGGSRNAKRLIYSNDGLIYYTEDHYNSFQQIY